MRLLQCFILMGLLAAGQGIAIAQGRPGGALPAAAADEHRHAHAGEPMPAASAETPAAPGAGRGPGRDWTQYPAIVPVMRGERDRAGVALAVKNIDAAALEVFAPDPASPEARRQAPVTAEGATVTMVPKLGNFYWLSTRAEKEGRVSVASTVTYFSEPGPAPTKLLLTAKNELEIIPQPLPREHSSYRESEKWKFLLRYNGQPLAGKAVKMETEFGTKTAFTSDANGLVTVLFPRDFKPAEPGRESGHHAGPRGAKFVLAAEHEADGRKYLTAFNYTYSPDADRGKSLAWGAAFGVLGMAAATPLLRRRAAKNGQGEANA